MKPRPHDEPRPLDPPDMAASARGADHAPDGHGRSGWVLPVFLVIAAFFLFTEHRAHLFGILPYLLLLACPLMHLFMHHGHGGHGHPGHQASKPPADRQTRGDAEDGS